MTRRSHSIPLWRLTQFSVCNIPGGSLRETLDLADWWASQADQQLHSGMTMAKPNACGPYGLKSIRGQRESKRTYEGEIGAFS